MPRLLLTALLMLLALGAEAQTTRVNVMQETYGGPYPDLPQASREAALKYGRSWRSVLRMLGNSGISDRKNLRAAYEKELAPLLHPLEKGNASEQKLAAEGAMIYQAMDYVAKNSTGTAAWDDPALNKLLRFEKTPPSPEVLAFGMVDMILDFTEITDHSYSLKK